MKSFICSIGTATPPYQVSQEAGVDFMTRRLHLSTEEKNKLTILYRATGIDYRYSVLEDFNSAEADFTFFPKPDEDKNFPSVGERMKIYKASALPCALAAIDDCLEKLPLLPASSITHLITVSCTGMYAPGLDIELIDALNLKTNIKRTAVNFMGCYGAFNALKVADAFCKSAPEAIVLIVCVELCTLHVIKSKEEEDLLSGSLFGDGAAAVIVSSNQLSISKRSLSLESFYCDILREGHDDMAWHISNFGFQMKLSSYVPDLIKGGIKQLTDHLLDFLKLSLHDIHFFAVHPGGKRILQVIESELGFSKEDNRPAYDVLKNYGNMSSPTVLFVLKAIFENLRSDDDGKNILSFAFGPGLTLESMLLKVNGTS